MRKITRVKVLLNSLCIADPSQSLSQSVSYFQLVSHLVSYSVYSVIQSVTKLVILSARQVPNCTVSQSVAQSVILVSQSDTQLHIQSVSQVSSCIVSQSIAQSVILSASQVLNCTVSQLLNQSFSQPVWYPIAQSVKVSQLLS